MMIQQHKRWTALFLAFFVGGTVMLQATAAENMIGRQSQNEGIMVVPAPGTVSLDGDLGDWDWSGRIWVFADSKVRDRYSVEVAAMWDRDYLYLAAKWLDSSPMVNHINPDYNFDDGWKSDSWQLRIKSDDTMHYTIWYYTDADQANFHVTYSAAGQGGETFVLKGKNGAVLDRGVQVAFRKTGPKTYNQEVRIPWALVYRRPPEIKAGLTFRMGNEFLWGDVTGQTRPAHRYADNMQAGVTSREFYWSNWKAWGNATLVAKGDVPVRQYVSDEDKLQGTLPVRVEIPADAVRLTVAINDADGRRVRNLAGGIDPRDYTVGVSAARRTVEVPWDCLDDAGKPAAPGSYKAIGLTHTGLDARYDMAYYNPGAPPWHTADGTGAWGSNHADPHGVARAGDRMILAWPFSEGGHAIIGLDAQGRKIWGELTGAQEIAADAKSVYAVGGHGKKQEHFLLRLNALDGAYKPFVHDGKPRALRLPFSEILGEEAPTVVLGLDADGERLALAMEDGRIVLLDAESAMLYDTIRVEGVRDVAFGDDGNLLYAVTDEGLVRIELSDKSTTAIPTPGLGEATRLDIDADGNIVVVDRGPDSQVKAYTSDGKLAYTAGKRGGRPWSGPFDRQAMMMVSDVAVDHEGHIWVAESWKNPRRISVWGRDPSAASTGSGRAGSGQATLVRDYIGNTGYDGTGSWMDEDDPTLGYVGPIEMRLDHEKRTYEVTRVLWAPDPEKGQAFPLWRKAHWYSQPQALVSTAAGGDPVRYIYHNGVYSQWHAVFIDDGQVARPVAAVVNAKTLSQVVPNLNLGTTDRKTVVFWNDKNGDAAVSRDECVVGPQMKLFAFWGNRMDEQLGFYVGKGYYIKPAGFTDRGAPIYSPESVVDLGLEQNGEYVPVLEEDRILCNSTKGFPGPAQILAFQPKTGKVQWSYPNPYPGVHGSHRATMPEPGLLIGVLKICGVADVGGEAGKVFAMRGNLGQDYYMTTDGLYVDALFQDTRLPGDSLPGTETELAAMSMAGFSEGAEPFSGWFGKQNDGKVRMLTSIARTAAMSVTVTGLDSIDRFAPVAVSLDEATLAQALADNAARQADSSGSKTYSVARVTEPPHIDGKGSDWETVPMLLVERKGSPNRATARISYDDKNLYALFEVSDPSPWMNQGKDAARLFKTGDAIDIQLGTGTGKDPARGDERIVFGRMGEEPVAVLMRPVDPRAPENARHVFSSPVGDKTFDRVELLGDARVRVVTRHDGYVLEAAVPLAALRLPIAEGKTLRGDIGVISSDAAGTINVARTYWSNKETNLVSDEPLEAWFSPLRWGTLRF